MSQRDDREKVVGYSEESTAVPSVPENRYDLVILSSIRRIIRAVDIYSRKLKASCELTTPQLVCLSAIVERESTTQRQIASEVFLSPSTVVGILDRLERRGLIVRCRDERDRRVVNISATAAGREMVAQAPSPLQDKLAVAVHELPELEQATLALSLKRVSDLMEAGHLDAAPILGVDPPDLATDDMDPSPS